MARPNVKKQIELPAPGASLYGVECYLTLVADLDQDAFGYSATGDVDVAGTRKANASSTGLVTFTSVRPNSGTDGISNPAGTVYKLSTRFPAGPTVTEYISVPNTAGDVWVQDILTTQPTDLPSAGITPAAHATTHLSNGTDPITAASTSVGGLMSAADKTKLNAIESAATADQTGAEILAALLPVDGAASGLDADLLDGQQGAAYILSSGLTESVQDVVGAFVSGASGVTVTYDDNANTLSITIADGALANAKLATNPLLRTNHTGDLTLPATGATAPPTVALHSDQRARHYAWFTGPTGVALPIADATWARTWVLVTPNAGTAPRTQGTTSTAVSAVGTVSHPTPGTTASGIYTNIVSAASTNVQASLRTTGPSLFRGASSDAYAGFEVRSRVRYPDASYNSAGASTGSRLWALGLFGTGPSTMFGADRGGTQDLIGFVRAHVNGGATDTNWQLVSCDNTTTTTTDTGLPFVVGDVYQFALWCPAGGTAIEWRAQNITAATSASGQATANLPRTTSALDCAVGLLTVDATARNVNIHRIFLSTDKG